MIEYQAQKRNILKVALEPFLTLNSYHVGSYLFCLGKRATQVPDCHDWRILHWAETSDSLVNGKEGSDGLCFFLLVQIQLVLATPYP